MNIKETINKITKAGQNNVQITNVGGGQNEWAIEIRLGGVWTPILSGLPKPMAEDIVKQAKNRVICG